MACSVPHTYDEIKSMVEKQIQEDLGRQLAIMNLGHQFDNAITAKDELQKAYKECRDIPLVQLCSASFIVNMEDDVDINTLTIEQYLAWVQDDIRPGLVKPKIGNVIEFEINSNFMRELIRKLFKGTDDEDAHEHVQRVLEISDLFHFPGITHDAVMLRVFPIALWYVEMDYPNITIEEYIRLEEEKARGRGQVYNWETATYAIIYNEPLTSKSDSLSEPVEIPHRIDEFDLKDETSLSKYDEEEQNVLYFMILFPVKR
ncbi:hypothetical protein Tco_0503832 [Tanacetum coccineum]